MSKNIEVALVHDGKNPVIITINRWRWTDTLGGIKIKLVNTRHSYFRNPTILIKINRQKAGRNCAFHFNLGLTWRHVPTYDIDMRLVDRNRNAIYNFVGHTRVSLPPVLLVPAVTQAAFSNDDKS